MNDVVETLEFAEATSASIVSMVQLIKSVRVRHPVPLKMLTHSIMPRPAICLKDLESLFSLSVNSHAYIASDIFLSS